MIKVVTTIVTGEGGGGQEAGGKKKVQELEVKENEIRKSNLIVILGGKVDIWMAGFSGAGVFVKYHRTASIFHLNFRKLRSEGLCLKFFMIPKS